MERAERRRRTAGEMMRDAPRTAESATERHAALWEAVSRIRDDVIRLKTENRIALALLAAIILKLLFG